MAPFNIVDLEAVLSLNLANDTLAIRMSVPLLTDDDIHNLVRCAEMMEQALEKDDLRWVGAYHEFLATLIRHSSPHSRTLSRQLIDDIGRYRASFQNLPSVWIKGPGFRRIIEAACERDGALASVRYAELSGRRSSLIMASVSPTYDSFRLQGYIAALVPAGPSK